MTYEALSQVQLETQEGRPYHDSYKAYNSHYKKTLMIVLALDSLTGSQQLSLFYELSFST